MRRWSVISFVLLLALLPVLHSHALFSDRTAPSCAACIAGTGCVVAAPVVAAPVVLAYTLLPVAETPAGIAVATTCSPRAPPSAG